MKTPKNKRKRSPIRWLALHLAQFNDPTRSKAELATLRATLADRFYAASYAERRAI